MTDGIYETIQEWIMNMNDLEIFMVSLVFFYLFIALLRVLKVLRKSKCPRCAGRLTRSKRSIGDYVVMSLLLGILPLKRYKCVHCGWSGLRWKVVKKIKKGPRP